MMAAPSLDQVRRLLDVAPDAITVSRGMFVLMLEPVDLLDAVDWALGRMDARR